MTPGVLHLHALPSNQCVLPDEESSLKLLLRLEAEKSRQKQMPLNVCLAMDRSFSMQEDHKLERAKEAAIAFIDALAPTDIFSLVEFGTDVNVAVEAQSGASREMLKDAVRRIVPRSATNLFDALHAAGATVARAIPTAPDRVNRVILLSDGVPTEGTTSETEILDVARQANRMGVSITTIGLGHDYDEVLLSSISEISQGNHYFVENAADIQGIFARELQWMQSVVAREVRLHLRVGTGVQAELANARYRGRSRREDQGWVLDLDDMERAGTQTAFFTLLIPPLPEGEFQAAAASVEYASTAETASGSDGTVRLEATVNLTVTPDAEKIREGIHRDVLRQWCELESFQRVATAVERGRTGGVGTAEVIDVLHKQTRVLEQAGSPRAAMLARIRQTIVEQGGVSSEVAKKTVVERIQAQHGGT